MRTAKIIQGTVLSALLLAAGASGALAQQGLVPGVRSPGLLKAVPVRPAKPVVHDEASVAVPEGRQKADGRDRSEESAELDANQFADVVRAAEGLLGLRGGGHRRDFMAAILAK
ncbi:MAG: hypothetical protein ACE5IM_04165 [Nitrospinota bacterium]